MQELEISRRILFAVEAGEIRQSRVLFPPALDNLDPIQASTSITEFYQHIRKVEDDPSREFPTATVEEVLAESVEDALYAWPEILQDSRRR